jgi:hypothetical protein
MQDDKLVDALFKCLDLYTVILGKNSPVNGPLYLAVLIRVRHLALEANLLLLNASLVLKWLEELVDRCYSEAHLGLIAVGLALEGTGSLARHIGDHKAPLPAVVDHLDLVKPVRVSLEDLNLVVIPGDVAVLVVDLAVDGALPVLDLTEALQLAGEVAGCV